MRGCKRSKTTHQSPTSPPHHTPSLPHPQLTSSIRPSTNKSNPTTPLYSHTTLLHTPNQPTQQFQKASQH
ncbi:hypothetical protein QVD17_03656 [Tagetes erecta]|uniref:Uncharacterized protein n=1 Tax=Tagetes erecta TaxID=13708 RepID=A0AAD8LES0_TARER|nr:hypothetical protein QVD17_03656 [Tagetes erecta]